MYTTLPPSPPRAYRVERFVGRGGFGHVYLASPLSQGTLGRVALKVMDEDAAEEWVARFYHEAQVLSRLSGYPNFVHVNAVFRMERRFCIDMEYVAGLTLDALVARVGALPVAVALNITRQVALALDAASNRARDENGELLRVLHRDMKPGNLRLGAGGVVKILDFGLARSELRGVRPETLKVLPATLAYMAPERFGFRADIGAPADVYALGLTFYEMLAGKPFFHDPQLSSFLLADREQLTQLTEDQLSALPGAVSAEVRALLARMLDVQPESRATAAESERACRELLGLHGEDAYRAWVESELEPLQREGQSEPGADPWRWVGTVRRSDVDHEAGADPEGPEDLRAISTFPPEDPAPTLVAAATEDEPVTVTPSRRVGWLAFAAVLGGLVAFVWVWGTRGEARAWYQDADGDGFGAGPAETSREAARPGFALRAGDCDEARADVHPSATEVCDGVDQDCDEQIDEDLPKQTWFIDADGDGLGAAELASCAVNPPEGAVATGGDCDDGDPRRRTGCGGARAAAPAPAPEPEAPSEAPTGTAAAPAPVAAPVAQGHVAMTGAEATRVRLDGPASLSITPGAERALPAGHYSAKVEFEGGDYIVEVTVPEGGLLTFDCTTRQMGRPCKLR